jgi:hypothetical protein
LIHVRGRSLIGQAARLLDCDLLGLTFCDLLVNQLLGFLVVGFVDVDRPVYAVLSLPAS